MELSKDRLAKLLEEAKNAHTEYEKELGRRDDNWPQWYANYIITKLNT